MKRIALLALAATIWLAAPNYATARTTDDGPSPYYVDSDGDGINDVMASRHRGFGSRTATPGGPLAEGLTDEQKAQLQETITSLRADGADRVAIHTAVGEQLQSFGVTLPDDWAELPQQLGARRSGGRHGAAMGGGLTDEQRAAIRLVADDLRAQGADREAIRAAVTAKFEELGVEAPTQGHRGGRQGRRHGR